MLPVAVHQARRKTHDSTIGGGGLADAAESFRTERRAGGSSTSNLRMAFIVIGAVSLLRQQTPATAPGLTGSGPHPLAAALGDNKQGGK